MDSTVFDISPLVCLIQRAYKRVYKRAYEGHGRGRHTEEMEIGMYGIRT